MKGFHTTYEAWLVRYAKVHKRSWPEDEKLYKRHVERRHGGDLVTTIDRPRIIEVLDEIADQAMLLQANCCQPLISGILSWTLDEGRATAHPALRIRRRGEERGRDIVMTADKVRLFWTDIEKAHANATIAMRALLLVGCRVGELVKAEKKEFKLDAAQPLWTIPGAHTKHALTHTVPLPPLAAQLFRDAFLLSGDSTFVFSARRLEPSPLDGNQMSRQCKEAYCRVGGTVVRQHDLRHQAATDMAECGVPMEIRQLVQNQITGRR